MSYHSSKTRVRSYVRQGPNGPIEVAEHEREDATPGDRQVAEQAERDVDAAIASNNIRTMYRVWRSFDYSHDGADTARGQDLLDRVVERLTEAMDRHPDRDKVPKSAKSVDRAPGAHKFYK